MVLTIRKIQTKFSLAFYIHLAIYIHSSPVMKANTKITNSKKKKKNAFKKNLK